GKMRLYQGIVAVNDMKSRPSRGVEGAAPYRVCAYIKPTDKSKFENLRAVGLFAQNGAAFFRHFAFGEIGRQGRGDVV
ncbi:MAG: hypothetical protein IKV00_08520, partial [Clostridia bacterium]|nr:hypothetical protein [Clostridia bacterium]